MVEFIDQTIAVGLTEYAVKLGRDEQQPARVCGLLAYHQSLTFPDYWCVTHIPTGLGICDHIATEEIAQQVVALALAGGIDWSQSKEAIERQARTDEGRQAISAMKKIVYG